MASLSAVDRMLVEPVHAGESDSGSLECEE